MFYAAACFRTSFLFSFPSGWTICIGLPCVLCSVAPVMSNSLWPYGLQPTSFLCPWDYPGKHIRVGCHVLLQGLSLPRDCAYVSRIASRFFTTEPPGKPMLNCCVTFIYSLISWLFLGFFSLSFFFLIITHKVAINTCVHILLCTYVCSPCPLSPGYILGNVETSGNSMFNLWGTARLFSKDESSYNIINTI